MIRSCLPCLLRRHIHSEKHTENGGPACPVIFSLERCPMLWVDGDRLRDMADVMCRLYISRQAQVVREPLNLLCEAEKHDFLRRLRTSQLMHWSETSYTSGLGTPNCTIKCIHGKRVSLLNSSTAPDQSLECPYSRTANSILPLYASIAVLSGADVLSALSSRFNECLARRADVHARYFSTTAFAEACLYCVEDPVPMPDGLRLLTLISCTEAKRTLLQH